jgi:uncharacterized damage-inducible protein DinB
MGFDGVWVGAGRQEAARVSYRSHMSLIAHFQQMLAYESWANERSVASLETVPAANRGEDKFTRACGLVPHNVIARRVWLMRIKGTPHENPKEWFPAWDVAQTRAQAAEVDGLWREFLAGLRDADLAAELQYTASDGSKFVSSVGDVLTHVFNHSTYHRGQIARIVHELGGQRASTDHIAFTRRNG